MARLKSLKYDFGFVFRANCRGQVHKQGGKLGNNCVMQMLDECSLGNTQIHR